MSVVKIDYLGTCEELELSTDSYAWWRPFYRWTFFNGEDEYSIVCRHAQSYLEKILKIALSKDVPIGDTQEAAKHQINQCIIFEDDIDHIGIDFFNNDGQLRIVGWSDESGEKVLFELHCNTAEFIHDIAKQIDDHLQRIGILYYDSSIPSAFHVNRNIEGFNTFMKQDLWLTDALSLSDIVLLKACVLGGYDTDKMADGLDVDLSRDIKILTTPIV